MTRYSSEKRRRRTGGTACMWCVRAKVDERTMSVPRSRWLGARNAFLHRCPVDVLTHRTHQSRVTPLRFLVLALSALCPMHNVTRDKENGAALTLSFFSTPGLP